jgi:DNA-binding MarR family transcriptional regulator
MATHTDLLDPEIDVLQSIHAQADHVRQRDLARSAGLSLGMTNAIVKRLVQKGWLSIRKVNNRNLRYAVSPEGIEEITRRSYRFLKRTIRNIVDCREAIEGFVTELKKLGYQKVLLAGSSDLDFIVESACRQSRVAMVREEAALRSGREPSSGVFLLYAESFTPEPDPKCREPGVAFLQEIVSVRSKGGRPRGEEST